MHYSPILAPVVALVAWTLLVMVWMMFARAREFRRPGVTFRISRPARAVSIWKAGPIRRRNGNPTITTI